jgi:hypothetical protein
MRTATPWWISVVLATGLLFVYLGERAFGHAGTAAVAITWIGVILIVGATLVRAVGFAQSRGKRRSVELILLLCHVGVLVALAIYAFAPEATGDAKAVARRETIVMVLWSILLLVSLVPLLMAEVALGVANRTELVLSAKDDGSEASVDSYRVKAMASSGLTIALAAAFLMVTCNVADQRNISKDVSYFRTSSPGTATVAMTKSISEPLKVLLFFPDVNEVREQVYGYFDSLASKTGNVEIEQHDRMISSELAEQYKVTAEGTIVLARGDKFETFTVNEDIAKARRNELRTLDETVQKTLMKVIRDKRVAYMTVGHGELNDPGSGGPLAAKNPAQAQIVKTILSRLNYQVKDLARDVLTVDVPEDASIVLVLGPLAPMMDAEVEALDRYLGQGGSLMLALDPQRKADLGALSGRLGVTWNATALADDDRPMRMRGSLADNVVIVAKDFSSHASVTTLSRVGAREGGLPFVMAGSFDDAEFTQMADPTKKPKRTYAVTSPKSSFRDTDRDFKFTKDVEARAAYNLVAAIEDAAAVNPDAPAKPGVDKQGMRAMLFSDVELFADMIQGRALIAQVAFADGIKWLGGEEIFAGETESEKDVRIKHTRSRDAKWFYGTIVGAPFLILGLGLMVSSLGRRRSRRKSS